AGPCGGEYRFPRMGLAVNVLAGADCFFEPFLGLVDRLALFDGPLFERCDGGPVVEAEDVIGCRYFAVVFDVCSAALPDLPGCRDRPEMVVQLCRGTDAAMVVGPGELVGEPASERGVSEVELAGDGAGSGSPGWRVVPG